LCKDDMGTRLPQTTQIDSSIVIVKHNLHYDKLCPWQPYYLTTKALKQLIYNHKLINKMPHQKIKELYCNCKLVARCIFIEYNVRIVYVILINQI
jgi:hypothetical protein